MEESLYTQGQPIFIYDDEIQFIKGFLKKRGITQNSFDEEQNILNLSRSYVGFIKTPHRTILLEPKHNGISLSHVMRIYYFVYGNLDNLNDDIYDLQPSDYYLNLTSLYVKELESICRRGLPVEYVHINEINKYVRGSLNLTNTYRNVILKKREPFDCFVDELTLNNSLNKVLAGAFMKIRDNITADTSINHIVKHLNLINYQNAVYELNKVTIDRKNSYCKFAYILARLILTETYFNNLSGDSIGECFLINFDKLFEDFIKKLVIFYSNDFGFSFWNEPKEYGFYRGTTKKYQPDILYKYKPKDNTCYAIIDVKNKPSSIFTNADVFQMLFYSGSLYSRKLILCYPSLDYQTPEVLKITTDGFFTDKIYSVFINVAEDSREGFRKSINQFITDLLACLDT